MRPHKKFVVLFALIATVLIVIIDVESVLVTGPIIFVAGAAMIYWGAKHRSTIHVILGGFHCAICLLCFVLAFVFHFGPQEATKPFGFIGMVYTPAIAAATVIAHIIDHRRAI